MELEWFVVLNLNFYNMISYDVNYHCKCHYWAKITFNVRSLDDGWGRKRKCRLPKQSMVSTERHPKKIQSKPRLQYCEYTTLITDNNKIIDGQAYL